MQFISKRKGQAASIAGWILSAISIVYIAYLFHGNFSELSGELYNFDIAIAVVKSSALYAVSGAIIALAWAVIINALAGLELYDATLLYGKSQILKYLPTNTMHIFGRYMQVQSRGVSSSVYALSTAAEFALIVCAAVAVASLFALPLLRRFYDSENVSYVTVTLILSSLLIGAYGIWVLLRNDGRGFRHNYIFIFKIAVVPFFLYLLLFSLNGIIVSYLSSSFNGRQIDYLEGSGIAAVAWIIGFITPGAPAGFGVRELILIAGLEHAGFGAESLLIALSCRIATLLGDIIFAAIAFFLGKARPS